MEFLIGRSLANNVTNLLLDPLARQSVKQKQLAWLGLAWPAAGTIFGRGRALTWCKCLGRDAKGVQQLEEVRRDW